MAPGRVDSCPSRIVLPSPQALEPQLRGVYESFGLNACQIELIAHGQPKRDYYYQSRAGNRLFDLDIGPVARAFAGASTPTDPRRIDRVVAGSGGPGFAGGRMRQRGRCGGGELACGYLPTSSD